MSDALLTEISKKLSDIHATLKTGGTPAAGANKPAAAAVAGAAVPDAAAKAAAAAKVKAAAEAKAKAEAEAKAKAAAAAKPAAGPASGTKAPGGKYTVDQVREKIREVATNPALGKSSASDILDQDGAGVKSVKDLKPENYDKVYEACQVALQSEGSAAAAAPAPEDDLM
jgi:colicin import membrane protein